MKICKYDDLRPEQCVELQQAAKQLGIDLTIRPIEESEYQQMELHAHPEAYVRDVINVVLEFSFSSGFFFVVNDEEDRKEILKRLYEDTIAQAS